MAKAAKAAAGMAAIYVITAGVLIIEDDDGTRVEKGKGGKVALTPDEVKALPDGVSVEPLKDRQERLRNRPAMPASELPFAEGVAVAGGLSEETAERFIGAVERFETAVDKLVAAITAPDEDAGDGDDAEQVASDDEGGDTKPASKKAAASSDASKA